MKIINKTKKTVVSSKVTVNKSFISKAIGLMFSKNPKTLIFHFNKEKKVPLHMFFVFFPIDVLFVNKDKKIVEIKENFKPWAFYNTKSKAQYVIELPTQSINKSKTKVKDQLEFT